MYNNISKLEINKSKVIKSVWIQYSLLILFLLIVQYYFCSDSDRVLERLFFPWMYTLMILVAGAAVWMPFLFITVVSSYFIINKKATEITISSLLIAEVLSQTLLIYILVRMYEGDFLEFITYSSFLFPAQFLRWRYLKYKNRLFN